MAKTDDFWFKFFPQKWMSGTAFMNYEERGLFITLLCFQHQSGRIPEKTIRFLVGSDSVHVWDSVKSKFEIDEDGYYYNPFLEEQIGERLKFNASRIENGKKGGRPKGETKATDNLVVNLDDNLPKTYPNSNSISNSYSEIIDNSESSIISIGGMQGGNDFSEDYQSQAVLYREFLNAYGDFGRQQKRGAIEQSLMDAVRRLKDMRPERSWEECAYLLIFQAKAAFEVDRNGNVSKRLNPETWLQNRIYETNIEAVKMPSKKSSIESMDEAIRNVLTKHIQETEANQ
jgi:hypothetical protein